MVDRIQSFPAIIPCSPKLLILGSMPSVRSLQEQQYYGNPRNHFWPIFAALLQVELPTTYSKKIQLLEKASTALWDVLASCRRQGSSDASIADREVNPLGDVLNNNPTLRAVAFNGREAQRSFDRFFARQSYPGLDFLTLPSSSPIPTRQARNWQEKLEYWRVLEPFLA